MSDDSLIDRPNKKHEKKTSYDSRFQKKIKRVEREKETRPKDWLDESDDIDY